MSIKIYSNPVAQDISDAIRNHNDILRDINTAIVKAEAGDERGARADLERVAEGDLRKMFAALADIYEGF